MSFLKKLGLNKKVAEGAAFGSAAALGSMLGGGIGAMGGAVAGGSVAYNAFIKEHPYEEYAAELRALDEATPTATAAVLAMDAVQEKKLDASDIDPLVAAYHLSLAAKDYPKLDKVEQELAQQMARHDASHIDVAKAKGVGPELIGQMVAVYERAAEEKMRTSRDSEYAPLILERNARRAAQAADTQSQQEIGAAIGTGIGGMAGFLALYFYLRDKVQR